MHNTKPYTYDSERKIIGNERHITRKIITLTHCYTHDHENKTRLLRYTVKNIVTRIATQYARKYDRKVVTGFGLRYERGKIPCQLSEG